MFFTDEAIKRGGVTIDLLERHFHLSDRQRGLFGQLIRKTHDVINRYISKSKADPGARRGTIIKLLMTLFIALFLYNWGEMEYSDGTFSIRVAEKIIIAYETLSDSHIQQNFPIPSELPEMIRAPKMLDMNHVSLLVYAFVTVASRDRTAIERGVCKLFAFFTRAEDNESTRGVRELMIKKLNLLMYDGPSVTPERVTRLIMLVCTVLFLLEWEQIDMLEQIRSVEVAKIIIATF
jgi:hypothetical protein